MPAGAEGLGHLVVGACRLEAEVPGTGVQHDPEEAFFIGLELDEMVAAAQGAQLLPGAIQFLLDDGQVRSVFFDLLREGAKGCVAEDSAADDPPPGPRFQPPAEHHHQDRKSNQKGGDEKHCKEF
jgi:hypothetical protein